MKKKHILNLIILGILAANCFSSFLNFFFIIHYDVHKMVNSYEFGNQTYKNVTLIRTKVCMPSSPVLNTIVDVWQSIFCRAIFPAVIMITFSSLMIKTVWKVKRLVKDENFNENQFGFISICMNIIFILMNTPVSITYIIQDSYMFHSYQDPIVAAKYAAYYVYATDFSNLYYSGMFFMAFGVNKLFRKETLYLLGRMRFWRNRNHVENQSDITIRNSTK